MLSKSAIAKLLRKGVKTEMPVKVEPMLATLTSEAFDDDAWGYEVKWDGYRAMSYIQQGTVDIYSRNNKPFTDKYYSIAEALRTLSFDAVIDGEIVVLDEKGRANFSALQNWRSEADGQLVYYVFDLIWLNGISIAGLPLKDRQHILETVFEPADDRLRLSRMLVTGGTDFLKIAAKMDLEGIMAKRLDSLYNQGRRSKDWLKIKVARRQEVVIGGFTKNEGSAKPFSSLLLGVYEGTQLKYAGKVGTGFNEKTQRELLTAFKPYLSKKNPFSILPDINKPSRFNPNPPKATAFWLKPELVCEVSFTEITSDGVFRHPSFQGMRRDKPAKSVVLEVAADTLLPSSEENNEQHRSLIKAPGKREKPTLLNPNEETQVKKIKGKELKFGNLSKLYWPEDGFTKRDMLNYYYKMAEYVMPYLKDRPLSLNRFPNGIHGTSFYQKDVKGKAPTWVKTFPYTTSDGDDKEFLVGDDEATLLWMASLGCIEMNPWFSRIQHPDNPDYCVIDLDPDKNTFEQVIVAAKEVKKVLDIIEVPGFVKTSGSTGIHIYIPLGARYTYDQSQLFGKLIVSAVHNQISEYTSMERQIKNRKGKMYLDYLQNRPGATIAGPYSLRPKPGATVSMPLHWEELRQGLSMKDFTIHNAVERVKSEGDIFKGCLGKGIDMEAALKKYARHFQEDDAMTGPGRQTTDKQKRTISGKA